MFDIGLVAILLLGILLGGILFNAGFRKKFFVGFRKFLGQLDFGGKKKSKAYEERQDERGKVHRRYIRTHVIVKCPECNGSGWVIRQLPKMVDERLVGNHLVSCPVCEGTGEVEA